MSSENELVDEYFQAIDSFYFTEDESLALKNYVTGLVEKGLPVIFNIGHFSYLVDINYYDVRKMINSSESFYYSFKIPKRRGGERVINNPYPSLRSIQKWILTNILEKLPISKYAYAFIKGKSIVDNANQHLSKQCLLKMDLKDFFPSIKINRVISLFEFNGYPHHLAFYLASLCCLNSILPQGASTSPYISNLVAYRLDARLGALAEKYNLSFTRYADDLTFSGKSISFSFIDFVKKIIIDEGFIANDNKTILIRGRNKKKIVTGISVSGKQPKLPRETKRQLRLEAYYINKYGLYNHLEAINHFDPIYRERIIGRLNFWNQIEPENKFVNKTIKEIQGK